MKEIYSVFITASSGTGQSEIEINAHSLEELDIIIANNFKNYQELRSYIIHETSKNRPYKAYGPYPQIKAVTKDKHQYTEYFIPIFEIINQERIMKLCKDALINKEKFKYKQEDLMIINNKIKQDGISYCDVRECSFALKRLGYTNVCERVIEHNPEYNINKYLTEKRNKIKKRTNDLHFL